MAELNDAIWQIHCDGSALPNRGAIGVGVLLVAPDGTAHTVSRLTGRRGCCNEAEALALIVALETAHALGARAIDISCDSTVLIDHTIDATPTTVARLARLYDHARSLLAQFDDVALRWVPRRRNTAADALARAALGLGSRPDPKPTKRRP